MAEPEPLRLDLDHDFVLDAAADRTDTLAHHVAAVPPVVSDANIDGPGPNSDQGQTASSSSRGNPSLTTTTADAGTASEQQPTLPALSVPVPAPASSTLLLHELPHELLLCILANLDVPDLLAVSRTTSHLRPLPLDPILHQHRLHSIPPLLAYSLSRRPPLSSLKPPRATIYLTNTALAARRVSRELISARLRRRLGRRPEVADLVSRNVMPGECAGFVGGDRRGCEKRPASKGTDSTKRPSFDTQNNDAIIVDADPSTEESLRDGVETAVRTTGYISPTLIHAKRRIERERVKDRIRSWVESSGRQELERRLRLEEEEDRGSVKGLIRRIRARGRDASDAGVKVEPATTNYESRNRSPGRHANTDSNATNRPSSKDKDKAERWGRGAIKWAERRKRDPTRAHVLALRRFWESVGRAER